MISILTPFRGDHEEDLSYIQAAPRAIAPRLREENLVILESSSPVGATEKAAGCRADAPQALTFPHTHGNVRDIRIGYCPGCLLPEHILWGHPQNARAVGGMPRNYSKTVDALNGTFVGGECIVTDKRNAETFQLTEHSFRDINIALANALSTTCEKLDIFVWELIKLANRDPPVTIPTPGPAVADHSVAADPWFIASSAIEKARPLRNTREVISLNLERAMEQLHRNTDLAIEVEGLSSDKDSRIAFYGIAFTPNIDCPQESPSLLTVGENGQALWWRDPNYRAKCRSVARLFGRPEVAHTRRGRCRYPRLPRKARANC